MLLRKLFSDASMMVCLNEKDAAVLLQQGVNVQAEFKCLIDAITLSTVDNFQGEEGKVVILSTVRNNDRGSIGFLAMDNRVNVMLSRAKHGMVILGSRATVEKHEELRQSRISRGGARTHETMFHQVLELMSQRGLVQPHLRLKCASHGHTFEVVDARDMEEKAPDGGPCYITRTER
jgi:hypothetical protein